MTSLRILAAACLASALLPAPLIATSEATSGSGHELVGAPMPLGQGEVASLARLGPDGAPTAIGIRLGAAALDGLPVARNRTSRCFDLDGDGQLADEGECEGDLELRLQMPEPLSGRADIPFRWTMLNWHPHGHPPGPWQLGHFDLHFYAIPETELDRIGLGPCGIFIDCDDYERAIAPVPPQFIHPDHVNVDAAVGQMGNHLIDSKTPELTDPEAVFTHTWIYGAYDGQIIFHEVMLTRDHMLSGGSACHPIKQPAAWATPGWYPTSYCIHYDPASDSHEIVMSDFKRR